MTIPTPKEIREAREGLSLSQTQFATLMGYGHKARVYDLERGSMVMSGPAIQWFKILTKQTTISAEIKKVR